jgi:Arc/MetJ-type ribon-helix-helix transcriptional regulator
MVFPSSPLPSGDHSGFPSTTLSFVTETVAERDTNNRWWKNHAHIGNYDTVHNMKTIAITIDEDMLDRIDAIAGKRGATINRSRFIRNAIADHLTRIEKAGEEEREREIFKRNRQKLHRQAVALIKDQTKL